MIPGQFRRKGKHPERNRSLKMGSTSQQAHNQWKIFEEGLNSNIAARSNQNFSNIRKFGKGLNIAASSRIQNLQSSSKIPARPKKGSTLQRAPNPKTCEKISRCALSYFQFYFLKKKMHRRKVVMHVRLEI